MPAWNVLRKYAPALLQERLDQMVASGRYRIIRRRSEGDGPGEADDFEAQGRRTPRPEDPQDDGEPVPRVNWGMSESENGFARWLQSGVWKHHLDLSAEWQEYMDEHGWESGVEGTNGDAEKYGDESQETAEED